MEGSLKLEGFTNLEDFNCWGNSLTELDMSNCSNLKKVNRSNNKLTKLTFPTNPNNPKLLDLVNRYDKKIEIFPYQKFTNIEYLAQGGFSKIYKAKWKEGPEKDYKKNYQTIVLKVLTDSQNLTRDFLQEITYTKKVDSGYNSNIVKCYGFSQDPQTKDYLMVMDYKEDGNLRDYLKNKARELDLEDKLKKLNSIASGLFSIHYQGLVHRDFHSGNILNKWGESYVTDLGLCEPIGFKQEGGKIFGVLPYIAPEVLRGKPHTKASDIYSFGIVAYELLAHAYPYPEMDDMELALKVCQGLRPDIDKVPISQLLKDFIEKCWDASSERRPSAEELYKIIDKIREEKELEREYNTFSQNTPYQIHPNATLTSKMIDTKEITEKLKTMEYSAELAFDFTKPNLENKKENNTYDWTTIHSNFTDEPIQQWQKHNFTFEQCRDWINVGLKPTDANFCAWLRDNKQLTAEEVLNRGNLEQLNQEFFVWWQEQQQINIEILPKK